MKKKRIDLNINKTSRTRMIISIIMALLIVIMFAFSVSAEPGSLRADNNEDKTQEYEDAKVIQDIYCLGILHGDTIELEPAYQDLDLSEPDIDKLAQQAMQLTFKEGSTATPTYAGKSITERIDDVYLGLYLIVPHGSDLTVDQYLKTIKDESGNDIMVSIALTDKYEYRFKPIILSIGYDNPEAEVEIKGERVDRFGSIRIIKKTEMYDGSHPSTFTFHIVGTDDEGHTVYEDYAGLTLDQIGSDFVDVLHIPVGTTVTVTEVYTGSDLSQNCPDPEPVKIESADSTEVVIGDEPPSPEISVTFNNKYNYREDKGHGITNRFEYSEGGWDWYKDGVLQEGTK